jgi:hypothetical protein
MKMVPYVFALGLPMMSASGAVIDQRPVGNGYVGIVEAAIPYGWAQIGNPAPGFFGLFVPNTACAIIFSPISIAVQPFGLREASLNALQGFAQVYRVLQHSEPAFSTNAGGTSAYTTEMIVQGPQGNLHYLALVADGARGGRLIATYSCDNPAVDASAFNQAYGLLTSVVVSVAASNAPQGGDISNNSGATGALGVSRHFQDLQQNMFDIQRTFNRTHP